MTQKIAPDYYTTILTTKPVPDGQIMFPGKGSTINGRERAFERLDRLERNPIETIRDWATRPTDDISHRLKRHTEREDPGEIRARITTEDDRQIHGEIRIVALDSTHEDLLHVFDTFHSRALAEAEHPPPMPRRETAVGVGHVLGVQFRPEVEEHAIERPHVSLPVTIVEPAHSIPEKRVRSTTAPWNL